VRSGEYSMLDARKLFLRPLFEIIFGFEFDFDPAPRARRYRLPIPSPYGYARYLT
jgi:hypothetical protein